MLYNIELSQIINLNEFWFIDAQNKINDIIEAISRCTKHCRKQTPSLKNRIASFCFKYVWFWSLYCNIDKIRDILICSRELLSLNMVINNIFKRREI